jgi:hemerythrin
MTFTWNDNLSTGNAMIDAQHKQLFTAINDLLDACGSGHGKARIDSTMRFLIEYTHKHFGDEEELQKQYHYPGYAEHKKMHDSFKASIEELAKELQTQGATPVLVAKITASTGEWLIHHIQHEDKRVAAHIHG